MATANISEDDMSTIWLLVYFEKSKIVKNFQVIENSRVKQGEEVVLGNTVTIRIGKFKLRGKIIEISGSKEYLENNMDKLKCNYLDRLSGGVEKRKRSMSLEKSTSCDAEVQSDVNKENADEVAEIERLRNDIKDQSAVRKRYYKSVRNIKKCMSRLPLTPYTNNAQKTETDDVESYGKVCEVNGKKVLVFGQNETSIDYNIFKSINWEDADEAVKSVLRGVFKTKTLATHTLNPKSCYTTEGQEREAIPKLNPKKVKDIIELIHSKCLVNARFIKKYITRICAVERQLYNKRITKRKEYHDSDEDAVVSEEGEENDSSFN